MAGNLSRADFEKLGMVEVSPGVFQKIKRSTNEQVRRNAIKPADPIGFFKGRTTEDINAQYSGGTSGIFIPGNVPSSKNGRGAINGVALPSVQTTKYRKNTAMLYASFSGSFRKMAEGLQEPLLVSLFFVRGNKHEFDYINMAQVVCDSMKKHGWISDDNSNIITPDFRDGYAYDKARPGVIIRIIQK